MRSCALSGNRCHIVGIGGIGMSGLASLLLTWGYQVSGSDLFANTMTEQLIQRGVKLFFGHDASNIIGADFVAHSSAVKPDNPEITAAVTAGKPVISRAELLGAMIAGRSNICISGSHGKTTTTTLIASIMRDLSPTVICGGVMSEYSANVIAGSSDWTVVEADESDGTCATLKQDYSIITNVCNEHASMVGGYGKVMQIFHSFAANTSKCVSLCMDDEYCAKLSSQLPNAVTYALEKPADFSASNIRCHNNAMFFDVLFNGQTFPDYSINMLGMHNVSNALGAFALTYNMGISPDVIRHGLSACQGAVRRFDKIGEISGVMLYDDYAHHPNEIAATIRASRYLSDINRIIAVVQPHRFSRLADCLDDFAQALILADEIAVMDVYSAGESQETFNVCSHDLIQRINTLQRNAYSASSADEIKSFIEGHSKSGDLVLFMGAGSISNISREVFRAMEQYAA